MNKLKKEIHLEGIPVSEGIGIGTFHMSNSDEIVVPEFAVTSTQVSYEIARYRRALAASKEELQVLYKHLKSEGAQEASDIIFAHIEMLKDPIIAESIEEKISYTHQNTESVFMCVMDEYKEMFLQHCKGDNCQDRLVDIKDLSHRILRHLNPIQNAKNIHKYKNTIYADYEIVPSKAAEVQKTFIKGFISKIGGEMSHSALIARAKGIPFVSGINISILEEIGQKTVIVDGNDGLLIVNPMPETIDAYRNKIKPTNNIQVNKSLDKTDISLKNGEKVAVSAIYDSLEDLEWIKDNSINSIGLIRTEFLFLQEAMTTLSLEFQIEKYEQIIEHASGALLTFRLFDVGGDKNMMKIDQMEPNPALGCRSIRFLIKYPKIFSVQVKALFQASLKGNIRILLPFVTDYDELKSALAFIERERLELSKELNQEIPKLSIGCMVEVPSFALLSKYFAKECDFFSIGTNDLMQYCLAMDRICPDDENTFQLYHPSVLHLLKTIIDGANKEGIEVSICGEAASNVKYTKLLIGLGLRNISCTIRYIPEICRALSQIDQQEAEELARKALNTISKESVCSLIEKYNHKDLVLID